MKRVLLTLLAVVVVLGLFAAVGFTGYRLGYAQGALVTVNRDEVQPRIGPFEDFGPNQMPMREFGFNRGFQREFGMRGFPGMGFGLFSLWSLLWRLAFLALIVWFVYWLFTRSGWRLTRTAQITEPEPGPVDPEAKV